MTEVVVITAVVEGVEVGAVGGPIGMAVGVTAAFVTLIIHKIRQSNEKKRIKRAEKEKEKERIQSEENEKERRRLEYEEQRRKKLREEENERRIQKENQIFVITSLGISFILALSYFYPCRIFSPIYFLARTLQWLFGILWSNIFLSLGLVFGTIALAAYDSSKQRWRNQKEDRSICAFFAFLTLMFLTYYSWSVFSVQKINPELGIEYDVYLDDDLTNQAKLSKEEEQAIVYNKYYIQNPNKRTHTNPKFMRFDNLKYLIDQCRKQGDDEIEDKENSKKEENLQINLLSVPLPSEFNYTGVIEMNNPDQGLYHSFIRHSSQWEPFLPSLQNLPNNVRNACEIIESQRNLVLSRNSIDEHRNLLTSFSNIITFANIQMSQLDMYNFIRNTVTSENYMGERTNFKRQLQVCFSIPNSKQKMILAMGNDLESLDPENNPFLDKRPYRKIITIFFKKSCENLVTKMFDKDGFKKL
jgi:hypothetical protein